MDERVQLGQMLVESNLLTQEQLKMAMDFQKSVGGKLGAIIVKLGFIEDQTLTNFIARQQGIPVVNLDELVVPENLVKKIPKKLIEKHHVVPTRSHDGVLTVATSDPFDYEALEEIQLAVDQRVEMVLAPRSQILRTIHDVLYREPAAAPVKEKSKDQLLKDLDSGGEKLSKEALVEALIPLLIAKGVITQDELVRKAKELEAVRER
jgi:type II secretory ATPase GspE/PulE/Tfp pilus assembly ATPase PilB-like protein